MENNKRWDIVFVVLTYKISKDLACFFDSLKFAAYEIKTIIVDAYCAEEYSCEIRKIAEKYGADYISVENRGYSYGNNRGIEYALLNYNFQYLVISNPDIEVKKIQLEKLKHSHGIYGPLIYTLSGKRQNPFRIRYSGLGEYLNYLGYKKRIWRLIRFYSAFNRIDIMFFNIINRLRGRCDCRVYSLHGSFVMFTRDILQEYAPVYLEKMFLFGEEDFLAFKMKKFRVPMYYTEAIEVIHRENGTVGLVRLNTLEASRESYLVYYENKRNVN